MGQQQPPQENIQQHSADYAPYPVPVQQDYPDATPGVPTGQTWGTQVMGTPANPNSHPDNSTAAARGFGPGTSGYSGGHSPSSSGDFQTPSGSGGYPQQAPPGVDGYQGSYVNSPNPQGKDVLSKFSSACRGIAQKGGKKASDISKYAASGPSVSDVVVGRGLHWFKRISEGGPFNVFRKTFGAAPNEELLKTYVCYLSTSTGPVAGTLYISNLKLAFCSDRPLTYSPTPGQQATSDFKVDLPLDRVKSVNASANQNKPDEKYIQIDMLDNHEFWFMGFVNYDKALKNLREIVAKCRSVGASQPYSPGGHSFGHSFGHSPQAYQQATGPPPQGYPPASGPPPPGYQPNNNSGSQQPPYPHQGAQYPPPPGGGSGSYPPQHGQHTSY